MSSIRDVMTADVVAFQQEMPVEEALRLLIDRRISGAPVVDDDRRIVGVLSEVDLL
ncbi:MAG: CBS domain-containing protein, partial [Actinomycetia bacterium]|nr:CBS domain-containing protein [Actinomycetes bacterium]